MRRNAVENLDHIAPSILCILAFQALKEALTMNDRKIITNNNVTTDSESQKIDPSAPAGSKNSLGAESVRDGRPATDDDVVEAIDEMGPGVAND